jgi:uncharacterized membrane protein
MSPMGSGDLLAGPLGPYLAIAGMTVATYLCRSGGVLLMSRIRLTPPVERALAALPGSIVAATIVPIAIRSGAAGIGGIVASVVVARLVRNELAALSAGLAVAASARAFGW